MCKTRWQGITADIMVVTMSFSTSDYGVKNHAVKLCNILCEAKS